MLRGFFYLIIGNWHANGMAGIVKLWIYSLFGKGPFGLRGLLQRVFSMGPLTSNQEKWLREKRLREKRLREKWLREKRPEGKTAEGKRLRGK